MSRPESSMMTFRSRVMMRGKLTARHRIGLIAALTAPFTLMPSTIRAADTDDSVNVRQACILAHEAAQELRLDTRLVESRKKLRRCADEDCPTAVRVDCLNWLNEVDAAMPNIVVVAQSDRGDETNIAVRVDGAFVADHLDGKPIDLDPGTHALSFVPGTGSPVEMRLVIGQGEKNRIVRLDFRSPVAPMPRESVATPNRPVQPRVPPPGPTSRPIPVAAYAFGAAAIMAVASATYFGLKARSARSAATAECSPICAESVVDDVKNKALYSDISAGIAVATASAAVLLYITRPTLSAPAAPSTTAAFLERVQLGLSPSSGFAGVRGSFE